MKRIIVIGSSGAGKTTLAKELSAKLGIPHTELDGVYHQTGWKTLSSDEFVARVKAITDEPAWILCGNYYTRLGSDIWPHADTIIWCNYSFPRVFFQLLERTLRRSLHKTELWNGNRESFYTSFFTKDSIIVWMLKAWKRQCVRYERIYSEPDSLSHVSLVRLKDPRQTKAFLDTVKNS